MLLFLFLKYWFILLIPAVIAQIISPIEELVIPIGIPTKEAKAKIETHPVTIETKISYCSKLYKHFYTSYSLIHFDLFLHLSNFLFDQYFPVELLTYVFFRHDYIVSDTFLY